MVSKIYFYSNENSELSNFYMCEFWHKGHLFKSSEHAYQALKMKSDVSRLKVIQAETAAMAKKLGRRCSMQAGWESNKVNIMHQVLRAKFDQCEKARKVLLGTGDAKLLERSPRDKFWGYKGKNMLGVLLMKVREEIRKEERNEWLKHNPNTMRKIIEEEDYK